MTSNRKVSFRYRLRAHSPTPPVAIKLVGPVRLDGLCVCVVKPYFYNVKQIKQLVLGRRRRQPVTLVAATDYSQAQPVTTMNPIVVTDRPLQLGTRTLSFRRRSCSVVAHVLLVVLL